MQATGHAELAEHADAGQAMLAFLFTDIEGSSGRWERHPAAMRVVLPRHDAAIGAAVAICGGAVFKSTGDGICAAFATGHQAIAAALEAQRRLAAEDFTPVDGLAVRMAVHAGLAEARDGDYFGATLNRAARLLVIGHGGQILVSGNTASLVEPAELPPGAALMPLGEHRLRDLITPEAVHQLTHPDLRAEFPALRSLDASLNNLPRQAGALIGRETELAAVTELVKRRRLVTLTGAGGIGKTRLSLQLGAELLHQFPHGVLFVELATLTERAQIGEAVAALLSVAISGDRPAVEILASRLRRKRLLILFDNCEHLVAEVAAFAGALLCQTEAVTMLATSREALGVTGEQIYALHGLAVPPDAPRPTAAEALRYSAVTLFAERAARAVAGFTLSDAAAPSVAAICRRLDGTALAIELAAPWLRMLTPQELLARLEDRFALLTSRSRAILPRQQTLRALIGWSYDLLSPREQVALARLGVFGGSFTIAAASAVIAGGMIEKDEAFTLIASLLDKSMVAALPQSESEARFRLLESTRHYALEKLAPREEADAVRRRLAVWLIRRFTEARESWPITSTDTWTARYAADADTLRAAIAWTFAPGGEAALGVELVSLTALLWCELALRREHRRWLDDAIARTGPETPKLVAARIAYERSFSSSGGAFGDRRQLKSAHRALALYRALGDPEDIALAAARVVACVARPGEPDEAQRYLAEIEAALPAIAMTKRRAGLLRNLATVASFAGRAGQALALFEQALAISRHYRDPDGIETAGGNLAEMLFAQGDHAGAAARAAEVAQSCRRSGNLFNLSHVLGNLASYAAILGDLAAARAAIREALPLLADYAFDVYFADCVQSAALLAAKSGNFATAARLRAYSSAFYRHNEMAREPTEQAVHDALTALLDQAAASGALPAAERARLTAEGAALAAEEALALALAG